MNARVNDNALGAAQRRTLRQWLTQPGRPALRVGGCGHLMLDPAERANARSQLLDEVMPRIVAARPPRVALFVGLAPGADLLFLKAAADWLTAHGYAFDVTALLPVPVEHLLRDWTLRAQDGGRRIGTATRARMRGEAEALLARCDVVVPLYPDDISAEMLASRAFRQRQYRHLAALIAQHADVVVAILRANALSEPGGTAEILAWREQPQQIPPELRLRREHCARQPLAYIIDPRRNAIEAPTAAQAEDSVLLSVLQEASQARSRGNELQCLDLVSRALERGLRSRRLDYLRIQALADTGNTTTALDAYHGLDLHEHELDEDWLALLGRLEKDLGHRDPARATHHFRRSARAYLAAYQRYGGYYSGINAATMLLLAGQTAMAKRIAERVRNGLSVDGVDDPHERFFRLVSLAEAELLLGDTAACRSALARANRLLRDDVTRRASTRRQLARVCAQLGFDPRCLQALRLPPVVWLQHGPGSPATLPARLQRLLTQRALVYLAIRSPADLRLAEQVQAGGARLYLVLPCPASELLRQWRGGAEKRLHARLHALLDQAESRSELRGFLGSERAWAAQEAEAMTEGGSRLRAQRLGLRWQTFTLGDAVPRAVNAPSKRPQTKDTRRMVGLLFADFASFRRLDETTLPRFQRELLTPIAALIDRQGERVLVRKTWGDALHLVTRDARSAAELAAGIQSFIEKRRLRHKDLLGDLELRIAAHYAPAYFGFDPIESRATAYGTQLLFTARIEPVAPPGMIYVTQAFAARLSLELCEEREPPFALDYAGEVELAKRAGSFRLFSLRRTR